MSMYRQLWLAVVTSMLLALGGSLLASIVSARGYLESQLALKNADNAGALALSLSHAAPDAVSLELAVSALFDSGHYELIRVVDPMGKTLVERSAQPGELGAPAWFVRNLPLRAAPGHAQISDGWKQFGTITLVSNSRFAYGALWNSVLQMLGALAVSGLIGCYLGTLILSRLRKPLAAVVQQARAITERRFTTIAEPDVPELRQLAGAMNDTVVRLKKMFDEEAARLEAVRREANCDPLTGLANRNQFMARLREASFAEHAGGGALFIARLAGLAEANRQSGREATDELLRACGAAVNEVAASEADAFAARLNGADFALLAPHLASPQAAAERLLERLTRESARFVPEQTNVLLGGVRFDRGIEPGAVLAQVDTALAALESEGRDGLRLVAMQDGDEAPKSAEEWAAMIQNALDKRWVRLVSFPVATLDGTLLHRECPLRLMFDAGGDWQPAGRFLPVAERLKLTPQLDLTAVALGLDELDAKPDLPGVAINLSASSIQHFGFRKELRALLKRRRATKRLWLEVSEAGAFTHFEAFRAMCLELRSAGCLLGIEHFGRRFSEVGRLHDLGLDYLKVDAGFVHGLENNPGNQAFLRGLSTIAHGIGMKVIAEGVVSEDELAALVAVGFDAAMGPTVRAPD